MVMRALVLQVLWVAASCSFRPGAYGGDATELSDDADVDAIVAGDAAVDAGGSLDACVTNCPLAASCNEILQTNPAATSGVHTIDVDGMGAVLPFQVECDMTTMAGGWTLVGRERTGGSGSAAGPLRYLGIDSGNASALAAGTASGIIGVRFNGAYTDVMIAWGSNYIRFAKPSGFDIFANAVDTSVYVTNFSTSDTTLASWVTQANGAHLCIASRSSDVRPGDTSWAVKPRDDTRANCGCNDTSWAGRGAYYGGTPNGQQTACVGWGGGWAGVRDNGIQKGGIAPSVETRIWIR